MTHPDAIDTAGLVEDALARVAAAATADELRAVDADVLGRRSPLASAKSRLGALAPEARREAGRVLNEARSTVEAAVAERRAVLEAAERAARL